MRANLEASASHERRKRADLMLGDLMPVLSAAIGDLLADWQKARRENADAKDKAEGPNRER